jgi:hypothetical protein
VTDPINHAVGELLFFLAQFPPTISINISSRDSLLEVSVHAEALQLVEREGPGLDWPWMRLTELGRCVVEEAIAAMRAVH